MVFNPNMDNFFIQSAEKSVEKIVKPCEKNQSKQKKSTISQKKSGQGSNRQGSNI